MSKTIQDRGTQPFKSHLSHLLHWRYTSPGNADSYPPEQWNHLKSLYDTLLLRAMLDQLMAVKPHELGKTRSGDTKPALLAQLWDMKAPVLCQSVIHSLTRSAMKTRHFPSWITGYSACSAAFALAYILVIDPSIRSECFLPTSGRNSHMSSGVQTSSPFNNAQSYNSAKGGFENLMSDALSILDTVGKQFSRLSEYKTLIQALERRTLALNRTNSDEDDSTVSGLLRTLGPTAPRYMRNLVKIMIDQLHTPLEDDAGVQTI